MSETLPPYIDSDVASPSKANLRGEVRAGANRIIYNPRIFSAYATVGLTLISFGLYGIDHSPTTSDFLQGRIVDAVGTTANAALNRTIFGDGTRVMRDAFAGTRFERQSERIESIVQKHPYLYSTVTAFIGQVLWEVGQKVGFIPGTYDSGDIVAYGVGVLGWVGLNKAASYIQNRYILTT